LPLGTAALELRPAQPEDTPFLHALFCAMRGPEFAAVLQEPQLSALLLMQFQAQQSDYTRRFTEASHFLILIDGLPAGRIWLHEGAEDIRIPDISILPAYQRRGIGAYLYRQLMDRARQAAKPIRVSVFLNNDGSAAFHQKMGFQVTGVENMYAAMEWHPEPAAMTAPE
jgi:ribosomal protein S18 acetylase RimI-like enzyme